MSRFAGSMARTVTVCGATVLALAGFATGGPGTPESAAFHTLLAISAGEVEEGQLALGAAQDERVRAYARRMVEVYGAGLEQVQLSMEQRRLRGSIVGAEEYNRGSNALGVDQRGRPIPENNSGSPNGSTGFSAAGTDLNRDPGNGQPIVGNNGSSNGVALGPGNVSVNATRKPSYGSGSMGTGAPVVLRTPAAGAALGSNAALIDRNGRAIPENNAGNPTGTVGEAFSLFSIDAPQPAGPGGSHPGGKPATQTPTQMRAPVPTAPGMAQVSTRVLAAGDARLRDLLVVNRYSSPLVDDHERAMARLQGLSGADFDRAYLDRQISAHRYALVSIANVLPSLQASGSGETVRLTEEMRALVVQHLYAAEQLRAGLPDR